MKKLQLLTMSILILGALSGCLQAPTPTKLIEQSSDKQMMSAFAKEGVLSKNEWLEKFFIDADNIYIKNFISGTKGHGDVGVKNAIDEYANLFDSSKDEIATLYIATAKSRGNTVKMYKTFVNADIGKMTPHLYEIRQSPIWRFNLDPAFIEFDKNGRIVSTLIRKHGFKPNSLVEDGYLQYRSSQIVLGKEARYIEERLGNDVLANGYILTL